MQPAKRRALLAAALLAAPLFCAPAAACTISATGVAFGAYNPLSATNDDSTGTVNLACPPAVTAPIVALSTGGAGTSSPRRWRRRLQPQLQSLFESGGPRSGATAPDGRRP